MTETLKTRLIGYWEVNMIPKGTTHVWTPAVSLPRVGFYFRRCYYKRKNKVWYSYTIDGQWVISGNNQEWFDTEKLLGYFVTLKKFNSPNFIPVEEKLHA